MGYISYAQDVELKVMGFSNISKKQVPAIIENIEKALDVKIDNWGDTYLETLNYFLGFNVTESGFSFEGGNEGKAYRLEAAVEKLIEVLKDYGLKLTGSFVLIGEERDDIVKWIIKNGKLELKKAVISFE